MQEATRILGKAIGKEGLPYVQFLMNKPNKPW
jgi:hypothetical protein